MYSFISFIRLRIINNYINQSALINSELYLHVINLEKNFIINELYCFRIINNYINQTFPSCESILASYKSKFYFI